MRIRDYYRLKVLEVNPRVIHNIMHFGLLRKRIGKTRSVMQHVLSLRGACVCV